MSEQITEDKIRFNFELNVNEVNKHLNAAFKSFIINNKYDEIIGDLNNRMEELVEVELAKRIKVLVKGDVTLLQLINKIVDEKVNTMVALYEKEIKRLIAKDLKKTKVSKKRK